MVVVDLIATVVLAVLPFLAGVGIGIFLDQYRKLLLVMTGIPTVYFTANLLIALAQQGLRETLILGIPLGISPAFIMLLTAVSAGSFCGIFTVLGLGNDSLDESELASRRYSVPRRWCAGTPHGAQKTMGWMSAIPAEVVVGRNDPVVLAFVVVEVPRNASGGQGRRNRVTRYSRR